MTDFGGILDSLRSIGDDVSGFFNGATELAAAKGVQGGYEKQQNKPVAMDLGFYTSNNSGKGGDPTRPAEAENFNSIELEWLKRMQRFANMDTSTAVKLGGK